MQKAKIGFIGCGSHATHNLYPMLMYARCDLRAVCDIDRGRAERNARLFGARAAYTRYEEMLDREELDGVMIAGDPQTMHYEVGKKVLARGLPLFTEKPCAVELSQAEEMVALAREKGVFLMTGFMKRHGLTYRKARELIASGQFTPSVGFFKYAHWKSGGGDGNLRRMLNTMSVHMIDLAISFFGDAASVRASTFAGQGFASILATLRFRNNCLAQLMLDGSQPRIQELVEISGQMEGQNALIRIDNVMRLELHRGRTKGIDLAIQEPQECNPQIDLSEIQTWRPDYGIPNMAQDRQFAQGFAGEVREFCDAILEKREPVPGTDDAIKSMRVIDAICRNPNGVTELA